MEELKKMLENKIRKKLEKYYLEEDSVLSDCEIKTKIYQEIINESIESGLINNIKN